MAKDHQVKPGDGVAKLAFLNGHFPDTVWNHPKNATLKEEREHMDILLEGDVVHIPDLDPKKVTCATSVRHRFRRRGVPSRIQIQILDADEPRVNMEFTLTIDGAVLEGTTDAEGWIREWIPPDARQGVLVIGEDEYELALGKMDPFDTPSGVQQRLKNLGYYNGPLDGEMNDEFSQALRSFQQMFKIEETGEPDQATQDMLLKLSKD